MKREKHIWKDHEECVNLLGESDHHYIKKFRVCEKCGTRRCSDFEEEM